MEARFCSLAHIQLWERARVKVPIQLKWDERIGADQEYSSGDTVAGSPAASPVTPLAGANRMPASPGVRLRVPKSAGRLEFLHSCGEAAGRDGRLTGSDSFQWGGRPCPPWTGFPACHLLFRDLWEEKNHRLEWLRHCATKKAGPEPSLLEGTLVLRFCRLPWHSGEAIPADGVCGTQVRGRGRGRFRSLSQGLPSGRGETPTPGVRALCAAR